MVNFLAMLGLIFLVLKLTGIITWSWFVVLLPFLIPVCYWIFIGALLVLGLLAAFGE